MSAKESKIFSGEAVAKFDSWPRRYGSSRSSLKSFPTGLLSFLIFVLISLAAGATGVYAMSFSAAASNPAGTSPASVTTADFNGDGKLDLAVANYNSANVSILLGNGDGTFQSAVNYAVLTGAQSVTAGDFNGDGKVDLAVAHANFNTTSVLVGNGDGTFQARVNYVAGSTSMTVISADFNGDGNLDLAVANSGSSNISILPGIGDGTFLSATNYAAGSGARGLITADFNGDGKPDLAVANYLANTISVLLNNGSGAFPAQVGYAVGTNPNAVTTGDFNSDGMLDLAVSNRNANIISVLAGNGNGTFQAATNYAAGSAPYSIITGDFNGDGRIDLAEANFTTNDISILLNNCMGTFQSAANFGAGTGPVAITVGDFNGDGKPDLAVANSTSNDVSILMNTSPPPDSSPDAFPIGAKTDVAVSSVITSDPITVAGINVSSAISIAGGEYQINAGAWTSAAGCVNNNDTVTVRQLSSSSPLTPTTATLTIESVSEPFDITTLACTYTLTPTSANFPYTGGSGSIDVAASAGCVWNISVVSLPSSMTITSPVSMTGIGNGTITYTVSQNTSGPSYTIGFTLLQEGTIFNITQDGDPNCNWNAAASGNWSDPANWSCGHAPGATDDAIITVDGTYTVTLDVSPATINSLTLGGASGTQTLFASAQTLNINAAGNIGTNGVLGFFNGNISGAGPLTNQGALNLGNVTVNTAIDNRGTLTCTSNPCTLNGTLTTQTGSTIQLNANGLTLTVANGFTNNGTISFASGTIGSTLDVTAGTLVNAAGANINIAGTSSRTIGVQLNNQGTITVDSAVAINKASAVHTNSGTINANADITFSGATSFTNNASGIIQGSSTFNLGGAVFGNAGTIHPGTAGVAGTLFIVGTDPMLSSSVLNIDIGGTTAGAQYDVIAVSSSAALNGTLNVSLINSFVPNVGDSFTIMMSDTSITGTFSAVNLPALVGKSWSIAYNPNNVTLTVAAVPSLTVVMTGTGDGTITSDIGGINCGGACTSPYALNDVVTLSVTPASGSTFTGWSGGGCNGTGNCVVTVVGASSVSASFIDPNVIVYERFNSGIPAGWLNRDNNGNGGWRFDDPGVRGNLTGGTGVFAIADSSFSCAAMDAELMSPSFDVSTYISALLEFKTDFFDSGPGTTVDVDISTDWTVDGGTWTKVWSKGPGVSYPGPVNESLDITAIAAGKPDVRVRFRYYNSSCSGWWQLDDVKISGTKAPPVPGAVLLDTTFNFAGFVTQGSVDGAYGDSITHDSAGKVLVAGTIINGSGDMAIWRYNAEGTPDTTFNGTGIVVHNSAAWGGGDDGGSSITTDTSGRILVTGYSLNDGGNYDMVIWRYNPDGTLDTTFNASGTQPGIVAHNNAAGGSGNDFGNAITLDSAGRIIVTGNSMNLAGNSDMVIWRYNSDGTLDTGFNPSGAVPGIVVHDNAAWGIGYDGGNSITLDSTGRILVAGYSFNDAGNYDMVIWRYNPNGTLDTTFNASGTQPGIVVHNNAAGGSGYDSGSSIIVDSGGKILVSGTSVNASGDRDMVIWRYNADGAPDTTFNGTGFVVHNSAAGGNGDDFGYSIKLDVYGRILVTGSSWNGPGRLDMVIWRYKPDGALDTTFNGTGFLVHSNAAGGNDNDEGYSMALDATGKVVVTGYSVNFSGNADMTIWRYAPDMVPPTVTSTNPISGATGVAINAVVAVTFSEPMEGSTIVPANVTVASTSAPATPVSVNVSYDVATNSILIQGLPGLSYNTSYIVTIIGPGGVQDASGNPMTADYTFTFTTACPVITLSPASLPNGLTGVSYNGTITASGGIVPYTYSMMTGTLPPGLTLTTGGVLSGTPNTAGTFNFTIAANDVNACSGAQTYTLNIVVDTTPPTVQITTPAVNAAGVALNSPVTITWSENIDCTTVDTTNITMSSGGWALSGCSGNQTVFTTSGQAYLTTYTVTIGTGIKDLAGNAMAVYQWSYTTSGCTFTIAPLSPNPADFAATGGSGTFSVTASDSLCNWTAASSDSTWLVATSSGTGSTTGSYTVLANTGAPRSATINVGGSSFNVNQNSGCAYTLSPASQTVPSSGGGFSIDVVATSRSCSWTATTSDSWITGVTGGATGNGIVTYNISANDGPQRTGTITIGGQVFAVTQDSGCAYTLTPVSQVPASGGDFSIEVVASSSSCNWTAATSYPWITAVSGFSSGNGTVTFTIAANDGTRRTGTISIGGQEFTITQKGTMVTITTSYSAGGKISPEGPVTVPSGSTVTFYITPDPGYIVTDVLIDESSIGAVYTATLMDLTDDHTIFVNFGK